MTHSDKQQPIFDYVDLDLISRVLAYREKHRTEFLEDERQNRHRFPQSAYDSAHYDSRDIGAYKYVLKGPAHEVRAYLREAAQWLERAFELRGTLPPFPVMVIELDAASPPGKPRELSRKALHPSDAKDYSLTNSWTGLQGLYLALSVGEWARARHIAEMVWDPLDASYIGPDSEVCTPDQQHLAYAVKQVILSHSQAALTEISLIAPKATAEIKIQATMVRAIAVGQNNVFLGSLADLLAWHQKMALRKANLNNPDFFLSIAGLGLCALALQQGIVQREQLPHDNVYLPIDLIPPISATA
jgi:hypothetical protein